MEVCEVLPVADHIALCHTIEQCVAQHSHYEEDQHDQDEDIKERRDRHLDCLKQRLEAFVLSCQAQHATHSQYSQHARKLRSNR